MSGVKSIASDEENNLDNDVVLTSSLRGGGTSSSPLDNLDSSRPAEPSLSCNLCKKALVKTCFLCACNCVFCEGECAVINICA